MNQQEWERVNNIVDTALDLEGEERSTFIREKCSGNKDLRYQVTKLLDAIEQSDTEDFLEGLGSFPANLAGDLAKKQDETYASSLIGETIDKYKITELIGYGGMGSVFLAERADDAYDRQIAFKVMRRGMDTPSNVARFKRERNILARLDHPNIARLLDGGVTADGLPYLVMEYVDGTPLLEYCNRHQLSINERLELFKSVCKAVQHAHRNTIIHRDLKPSNIYVSNDGTVKVLDFGIAKLMEPDDPEKTFFETQTGARILTLGYAAPEQIDNSAITTATDSYTLGILLYKLLAGSHPFDIDDKNISGIEKTICIQRPDNPSKKFNSLAEAKQTEIASQRSTTSKNLVQTLQGDLDAIVMKALRKEPEFRYRSVEQMLEDLNRYDQSVPLIAQSDTLQYRTRKFIIRHRNTVAGVVLVLIAILGFGSYHIEQVTEERNIAEAEAQKAETVKNFLIDIFGSSNPQSASFEGKDISAQQLLLNGKEQFDQELSSQPDVYLEIFTAIGDALKNIDAFEEAEKSYEQALSKASESSAPIENKVNLLAKIGHLNTTWTKNEKAYKSARNADSLLQKVDNPPPALKASVLGLLGRIITVRDDYEKGNTYFKKADSIYVNAGIQGSDEYIQMLTDYGRSLLYVFDFEKSEQVLLRSNQLHAQKYQTPTLTIAENYKYIAWTNREMGNFERSNNYFLKSVDLKSDLIGPESVRTAISMYHLARNYTLAGDFEKSEKLARQVLQIYQKHLEPTNQYVHQAKNYLAMAKYNQSKWAEAEKLLTNVVDARRELDKDNKMFLAGAASQLAVVYRHTGRFQEAISLLEETIDINERNLGPQSRGVAVDMIKLAAVYRDKGDDTRAKEYFSKAESILTEETPENHYRRAELYYHFGKLKMEQVNSKTAQQYFQKSHQIYVANFGKDSQRAKDTKSYIEQMVEATI